MRALLVVVLALAGTASAFVKVSTSYHTKIGIPAAKRIKLAEEMAVLKSENSYSKVGGVIAPVNAYPYLAGLLIRIVGSTDMSVCGSSLISSNRLVTAAHCWRDDNKTAWQFVVILGSNRLFSGGIRITTSTVIEHPLWTPSTLNNDIAIIYLPVTIFFSDSIQPIDLPSFEDMFNTYVGQWAVIAGFGKSSDQQVDLSFLIRHVGLLVITVDECKAVYGPVYVQPTTLCAKALDGFGSCEGDSGGPLVLTQNGRPILIGITSFGSSLGCEVDSPSAFTRVTSFYNFITQHII